MKKAVLILTILVAALPCAARMITVDDDAPADFNNIQAAIDDANDGDTVIVAAGTYAGPGNKEIDPGRGGAGTLLVRSANGPDDCIIRGAGGHAFYMDGLLYGLDTHAITIEGFTITNFAMGLLIHQMWMPPSIRNCIITGNTAGIYCSETGAVVTNCVVSKNAEYGIACFRGADPHIDGCLIANNGDHGVLCWEDGKPLITDCRISANRAEYGAGLYIDGSSPRIFNTILTANTATCGGAVYITRLDTFYSSRVELTNCTITGNVAVDSGGGIYCHYGHVTVDNSILYADSASEYPEIFRRSDPGHVRVTAKYSLVQGGWSGQGNIDVDPCFAKLGYWDPNGTPDDANNDFWVDGDYHLKSQAGRWDPNGQVWTIDDVTSPCIDAGDPIAPIMHELFPNPA